MSITRTPIASAVAFAVVLAAGVAIARPSGGEARPAPPDGREPASEAAPAPAPGAGVDIESQLMITDLRVIEDPVRTDPHAGDRGVWTFKYLIENMAGSHDPAEFALRWLKLWERDQRVNESVSPARPGIRELVIDPWLAASGGERLDLTKAPFKLLAIVNRIDLRVHDEAGVYTGGEGRFVFGVLAPDGTPLPPSAGFAPGGFTVIFEYELPATDMDELRAWTTRWRRLGDRPLGSPTYNAFLERITRKFTDRGRSPGKANGSSLNQIRTNEIALGRLWELREFIISRRSGLLRQHSVALTPDTISLNGTPALAAFINQNERGLLDADTQLAPDWFGAASLSGPFQADDFPDFEERTFTVLPLFDPFVDIPWSAAGIRSNEARHAFALNTCNGCHRDETATPFLQIGFPAEHDLPTTLAQPAALAGFLTGIDVADPVVPSTVRTFADLERRQEDLEELITSFDTRSGGDGPGPKRPHLPNFVH